MVVVVVAVVSVVVEEEAGQVVVVVDLADGASVCSVWTRCTGLTIKIWSSCDGTSQIPQRSNPRENLGPA